MIDPDGGQWLTYREAGQVLGISSEAVRSLARRKGWSRQTPNEIGGIARVLLPADRRARPGTTGDTTGVARRAPVERPAPELEQGIAVTPSGLALAGRASGCVRDCVPCSNAGLLARDAGLLAAC